MRTGKIRRMGWLLSAAIGIAALGSPALADNAKAGEGRLHGGDAGTTLPAPAIMAPEPEAAAPDTAPLSPAVSFSVTIPAINAVGSNVDTATLKDILSGKIVENATAIANLSADSITIPEIDISLRTTAGPSREAKVTIHDVDVEQVAGGIARSISIGSTESQSNAGGAAHFGTMSAEQVDLGGMLALYGLVKGDPSSLPKTLYLNFVAQGGTLTAPDTRCTIGKFSVARVKARPLRTPLLDVPGLFENLQTGAETPPEVMKPVLDFYEDVLSAIETSPAKFGGFACSAKADDGTPVSVAVGGMTIGSFGGLRYPEFIVQDLKIDAGDKGAFSLGQFELKGFSLASVFEAAHRLLDKGDATPSAADYRSLIPPFAGFSLSDLDVDTPDTQDPGQRIKATLGEFDLDLGSYVNGIPTDVASRASHLVVKLPPESSDSSVRAMLSVGLSSLDLSYDVAAHWDAASHEIRLWRLWLDGDHLGSINASSVIGNATDDLYSTDTFKALAAALGLTVKQVNLHIEDNGLGDLLAEAGAKGSGKGAAEIRGSAAAMVQATLLFFLGGAANGSEVVSAVGDFLNGAKSLTVTAISNDPGGISVIGLQGLASNPTDLGSQITIDATAR